MLDVRAILRCQHVPLQLRFFNRSMSPPFKAIELASAVEIGDSDFMANELCQLFYGGWPIQFDELTPGDIRAILSKLEHASVSIAVTEPSE